MSGLGGEQELSTLFQKVDVAPLPLLPIELLLSSHQILKVEDDCLDELAIW